MVKDESYFEGFFQLKISLIKFFTLFQQNKNRWSTFNSELDFSRCEGYVLTLRIKNNTAHRSAFVEWKEFERSSTKGSFILIVFSKTRFKQLRRGKTIFNEPLLWCTILRKKIWHWVYTENQLLRFKFWKLSSFRKNLPKFDRATRCHLHSVSAKSEWL